MQLEKDHVGRVCSTKWDDVGTQDGIVVEIDDDGMSGKILFFGENESQSFNADQVSFMAKGKIRAKQVM